MRVLLSWLRDFAPFGDDVDGLAEAMTALGMEVAGVERVGEPVPGVIVARVVETRRHPTAERVQQVFVDAGDGTTRQVWCGAFNMQAGDLVPLATLGTTMPDGRTIAARKILGEHSEGMLCSARELGLGEDAEGILVLPPGLRSGVGVFEALGVSPDVVFDLDLTRNRPDGYGHLGVARDVAAHFRLPFAVPANELHADGPSRSAPVEIVDPDLCGRFVSIVLSGVVVGPSSPWMAERLAHAGMRPINNVVDVSNYVMFALNEPNHAYDLATLGGGGFRVRRSRAGETLVTLDGFERRFVADDLLICDSTDTAIGIAGVMGGADTEIGAATTDVALEMAWFDPVAVHATSVRLGLRSEASVRFERGRDPYGIDGAVARFVELLRETCPTLVVHRGVVDARGELPPAERSTNLRIAAVNRLLGTALAEDDVRRLLDPIGFITSTGSDDVVVVALPSWRPDCAEEVDVIEEVARHYGYEALGKTVPKSTVHGHLSARQTRRRLVREVLAGVGVSEAMPNPFLAPGDLERAGLAGDHLAVANPLVAEERVLRTSLRPGLVRAVGYNESHRGLGVALYEIGHVYPPGNDVLPDEREDLCVVLAGREASAAVNIWHDLVAALRLGERADSMLAAEPPGMHPTRTAVVSIGGVEVGHVGEIDPGVLEAFSVAERVACIDISLSSLVAVEPEIAELRPVSRFPSSDIDLAFAVDDSVPAAEITGALRRAAGELLADLALFDVFRGDAVGPGRRSLAYRLRLQAADRTLTDAEVGQVRERCIAAVTAVGGVLRG